MRWWTSDLHFGHANICAYSGRPFGDVDGMNLALIERWNSRVAINDDIYVLGDFAMGHIADTLPLTELLNGNKILVPGNHDRCWDGLRGKKKDAVDRWVDEYRAVGFTIRPAPVTVELEGRTLTADHFPYSGDSQDEERYLQYRPADHGGWLLHGHVHEKWRQNGRMINVGVDAWGGYPVDDTALAALITEGPTDRSPLPWR